MVSLGKLLLCLIPTPWNVSLSHVSGDAGATYESLAINDFNVDSNFVFIRIDYIPTQTFLVLSLICNISATALTWDAMGRFLPSWPGFLD